MRSRCGASARATPTVKLARLPTHPRPQADGDFYLGFVNREGDEAAKRATAYRGAKDGKPDTRVTAYFKALVGAGWVLMGAGWVGHGAEWGRVERRGVR